MPTYNFLIKCSECDGEGEYETSFDPSCPIKECDNCENGYIEVEDYYDCETDLKQDYPDAVDIIDVEDW
ncbi:MAG: hypothetical protein VW518_10155 [Burkholderiaceae bacterium]